MASAYMEMSPARTGPGARSLGSAAQFSGLLSHVTSVTSFAAGDAGAANAANTASETPGLAQALPRYRLLTDVGLSRHTFAEGAIVRLDTDLSTVKAQQESKPAEAGDDDDDDGDDGDGDAMVLSKWTADMEAYLGSKGRILEVDQTAGCVRVAFSNPRLTNTHWAWSIKSFSLMGAGLGIDTVALSEGAVVRVTDRVALIKRYCEGHETFDVEMEAYLNKEGTVIEIYDNGDVRLDFSDRHPALTNTTWKWNPMCFVSKTDASGPVAKGNQLAVGAQVQLLADKATVKEHCQRFGGWNPQMANYLGKTGRVVSVEEEERGALQVKFDLPTLDNDSWTWNPKSFVLLAEDAMTGDAALAEEATTTKPKVGLRVRLRREQAILKKECDGHGGFVSGMTKYLGKEGHIVNIDGSGDIKVKFIDPSLSNSSWRWNPASFTIFVHGGIADVAALTAPKRGTFAVGDRVRLTRNQALLEEQCEGHGGWNPEMAKYLGAEAEITRIDDDLDIRVKFFDALLDNDSWCWNPKSFTLVEGKRGKKEKAKAGSVTVGARVVLNRDKDVVEAQCAGHGGWVSDMEGYLGKEAIVTRVDTDGDVYVKFLDPELAAVSWCWNPLSFSVVAAGDKDDSDLEMKPGSIVQLSNDRALVERQCRGHGGWVDSMEAYLDKTGRVTSVDTDGDIVVQFFDPALQDTFIWNPASFRILLAGADDFTPIQISVGDLVRLNSDEETVKRQCKGHGEWVPGPDGMIGYLGAVARVTELNIDAETVRVEWQDPSLTNTRWRWNARSFTPADQETPAPTVKFAATTSSGGDTAGAGGAAATRRMSMHMTAAGAPGIRRQLSTAQRRPTLGDFVALAPGCNEGCLVPDKVGLVIQDDHDAQPYKVKVLDGHGRTYFYREREVVLAVEPAAHTDSVDWAVGDTAQINPNWFFVKRAGNDERPWTGDLDNYIGITGKVTALSSAGVTLHFADEDLNKSPPLVWQPTSLLAPTLGVAETTRLTVGDHVTLAPPCREGCLLGSNGTSLVGIIIQDDKDRQPYKVKVLQGAGKTYFYREHEVQRAAPPPESNEAASFVFTVGDKIQMCPDWHLLKRQGQFTETPWSADLDAYLGAKGVVDDVDQISGVRVKFNNSDLSSTVYWTPSSLRKLRGNTGRLRVGEYVTLNGDCQHGPLAPDKIGVVLRDDNDHQPFLVRPIDGTETYFYKESDLVRSDSGETAPDDADGKSSVWRSIASAGGDGTTAGDSGTRPSVGTFVRLAADCNEGCLFDRPDRRGVILQDDRDSQPFKVGIRGSDRTYFYREAEISVTSDGLACLAFSVDGLFIATGGFDNTVRVSSIATGRETLKLSGHSSWVTCLAFSPTGNVLLTASYDKSAKLWDVINGGKIYDLTGHDRELDCCAISSDGMLAATGAADETVMLWSLSNGVWLTTLKGHTAWVSTCKFAPSGNQLASGGGDHTIILWEWPKTNVTAAASQRVFDLHTMEISMIDISHDSSKMVSGSADETVRIWDLFTGAQLQKFTHDAEISSVAFSFDTFFVVSADYSGALQLWLTDSGVLVRQLLGHTEAVTGAVFSPTHKGLIASTSDDSTVRLWDISTEFHVNCMRGHSDEILALAFSPCGAYIASAGADKSVRLWDAATGAEVWAQAAHTEKVNSLFFSPDGRIVATASDDNTIKVFRRQTGELVASLPKHEKSVTCVVISCDGKFLISGSGDESVIAWEVVPQSFDFNPTHELHALKGELAWISALATPPRGPANLVAIGNENGQVRLWTLGRTNAILLPTRHKSEITAVAFSVSSANVLATSSLDCTVLVWDLGSRSVTCTLTFLYPALALAFVGKQLAVSTADSTGKHNDVAWWDVVGGGEPTKPAFFVEVDSACKALSSSPTSNRVAMGLSDAKIQLWDPLASRGSAGPAGARRVLTTLTGIGRAEIGQKMSTASKQLEEMSTVISFDDEMRVTINSRLPQSPFAPIFIQFRASIKNVGFFEDEPMFFVLFNNGDVVYQRYDDLIGSCLYKNPTHALPAWYIANLMLEQRHLADKFLSRNPFSVALSERQQPGVLYRVLFQDVADADFRKALLKKLLPLDDTAAVGGFYHFAPILMSSIEKSQADQAEVFRHLLIYLTHAVQSGAVTFRAEDLIFDALAAAAAAPNLRTPLFDFLARTPLLPAPKSVSEGFEDGSAFFSDNGVLLTQGTESLSAPGLWKRVSSTFKRSTLQNFSDAVVTPFSGALTSTSPGATSFLGALVATKKADAFDTLLIRTIIDFKWRAYGKTMFLWQFFIYLLGLVLLIGLTMLVPGSYSETLGDRVAAPVSSMNRGTLTCALGTLIWLVYTLVLEVRQMFKLGLEYFYDVWNCVDITHMLLGVAALALIGVGVQSANLLLALAVYFRWFGVLYFLQAFASTGSLIRMIFQILFDMRWFLFVLAIGVLATANAFFVLLQHESNSTGFSDPADALFTMFTMLIINSAYNTDDFVQGPYRVAIQLVFVVSMVLVPIVLLNLLIALMNDSYEHIQDQAVKEQNLLKARILVELEAYFRQSDFTDPKFFPRYVHVLVPRGENVARGKVGQYQGMLCELKSKIVASEHSVKDGVKLVKKDVLRVQSEIQNFESSRASSQAELKEQVTTLITAELQPILEALQDLQQTVEASRTGAGSDSDGSDGSGSESGDASGSAGSGFGFSDDDDDDGSDKGGKGSAAKRRKRAARAARAARPATSDDTTFSTQLSATNSRIGDVKSEVAGMKRQLDSLAGQLGTMSALLERAFAARTES